MIREGEGRGKAGYTEGSDESLHLEWVRDPLPQGEASSLLGLLGAAGGGGGTGVEG